MVSMLNEKCWRAISILLDKGDNFKYVFRRLMADKRKSLPKHPYWCRRSRRSTPELLFPYLPGLEFVSPPMSIVQTMPVYLTSRSGKSLNSVSPFITGYASFADSIAPPDLSLIPSNSGPSHTESDVVEDLLI